MTPHFPITYNEKCGVILHITIIQRGMCGMIPYISPHLLRKEWTR